MYCQVNNYLYSYKIKSIVSEKLNVDFKLNNLSTYLTDAEKCNKYW